MKLDKKDAFLALGLDTETAAKLVSASVTPGKLSKLSEKRLLALGLDKNAQAKLRRPPIPHDRLFNLLRKCRRICCVCRVPNLNIVLHHINEWHRSKSHAEKNLVVLCLNDHGEAHTDRKLGQNLTPEMIRKSKEAWETAVRTVDARTVIGLSRLEGANWDYINLTRLFRAALKLGINFANAHSFAKLRTLNMVSEDGHVSDPKGWTGTSKPSFYLYDMGENLRLYAYTSFILEQVVEKLGTVDISEASREKLQIMATNGSLVFVQAPFYFRNEARSYKGKGQLRKGFTKVSGVRIEFTFDAWECTSSSSKADRLSGRKVASVVGLVSGTEFTKTGGTIQLSCLAIGTYFERIHWRSRPDLDSNDEFLELEQS
jgi:hypothetical protein